MCPESFMYRSNLLNSATYNHWNEEKIKRAICQKNPLELTIQRTSYIFSGTEKKYSKQLTGRILS